jgi:putative salt-induced outer membrane protein YdiY
MPTRILAPLLLVPLIALAAARGQDIDRPQLLPPVNSTGSVLDEQVPSVGQDDSDTLLTPGDASWWEPARWFASPVWDFGAEMGINGSAGNAQAFSIQVAFSGKRETEGNVLEYDIKYGKSQNGGSETQHYWLSNSRWDWKFTPIWFLYNKNTLEYDEFKAFDLRLVLSGGLGHNFIKNDATTLTGRCGAGASREFGGPDDAWVPEANLAGDFEHKFSDRQKVKLTSDYYPSWQDFHDYRLLTNAYWEILLDQQTNLSLKIGAIDRYDSTPNGAEPNDIDYYATLLWKM